MSKVRIVQLLCPSRHCIFATAYESSDGEQIPAITDRLREQAEKLIAAGGVNPWCGICRSRQNKWTYEDQPTIYATMDAAMPWLQANSDRQAFTREYFRASRS